LSGLGTLSGERVLQKVLIANRGEIAVRVIRTCRDLGIQTVAVHSEVDRTARHVRLADEAVPLDGLTARDTYLDVAAIIAAVRRSGADAVHPGYGFLAEDPAFASAVIDAGATWIGPPPDAIAKMGDKIASRLIADAAGVAPVPGTTDAITDAADVCAFAAVNRYPVAIKASRGGGGRGLRVVERDADAADALESARREALASFGDEQCYLERYLRWPRHVEVQVLADDHGAVAAIGDRDCSSQRRHQKLVEESPAPDLPAAVRIAIGEAAVRVATAVGYRNAGTVEFLYEDGQFWFLEMNTRLQVEHPVTEMVFGIDLVAAQLRLATGERLDTVVLELRPRGHAIELRVNAEDPAAGRFVPSPGTISRLVPPGGFGTRFDAGYDSGDEVPSHYDNLLGKLIVWAPDRDTAIGRGRRALGELVVEGVATTIPLASAILAHPDFAAVRHSTRWVEEQLDLSSLPSADTAGVAPSHRDEVEVNGRWYRLPYLGESAGREPVAMRVEQRRPDDDRPTAPGGTGRVVAPMQGTVVKVLVGVGDEVRIGDPVVVLEAMKMENQLLAERDGRVTDVRVGRGDSVGPGDLLVEIAPVEP
jgi:acetyl-CoA/propionyl-CoA/long-chain acyl-CoA carboxylase, biotin carboxylase, biotin carboxyl carrier protein